MSDQQPTTASPAKTPMGKYTLLTDGPTKAYQLHLRRETTADFSTMLRAVVDELANDKAFEARMLAKCGASYYDEEPAPTTPADGLWDTPSATAR